MKEKLTIRNFGPIRNVELELGRFNVLIGEQATGKSTVAKVLAVCRDFSYIMPNDYPVLRNYFEQGLEYWGLWESKKDDSFISYQCEDYFFSAHVESEPQFDSETGEINGEIHFFISEIDAQSGQFKNLLNEVDKINPNSKNGYGYYEPNWKPPTSFFRNDVAEVLDNPFYLPTERGLQSIFSLGKNSIQNISDSLFNQLASMDQVARLFNKDTQVEPLNIIYKNVDGKGFVRKNNEDNFYSLYNAASGFQSTIPVVLLIKYFNEIRKKKKAFIIEEPELNVFPNAQKSLIEFFVTSMIKYKNSFLINTHSPYILTSLNSLISAFNAGKEHGDEVEKIIERKYWLNPDDVSAYMMLPDGTCEDIFDREENLIHAEKIDGVSSILNKQFDEILNIEFAGK